jgi:hypothetical protein
LVKLKLFISLVKINKGLLTRRKRTMSLKYTLVKSHLTEEEKYYPRFVDKKVVSQENFIQKLKKDTALEQHDLKNALEQLESSLLELMLEGDTVHTPVGIFTLVAKGSVEHTDQDFDPQEQDHGISIVYKPTPKMKAGVEGLKSFEKVYVREPGPVIGRVYSQEHEDGEAFSQGEVIKIRGDQLAVDKTQEDEGVWFVAEDGSETRALTILDNGARSLSFKVPEVPSGPYTIKVTTRMGTQTLREVKTKKHYLVY